MDARRDLSFGNWDEVLSDLHNLAGGYTQHGKWNLAQVCRHLNDWLRFPLDGFPRAPLPVACLLGLMRLTVGPSLLRKIIASGKMKDGSPTDPGTVYPTQQENSNANQLAVESVVGTINRFRAHTGPIVTSPLFGKMDKATAEQLQLVHFAHHLSWLSPRDK